MNRIGLTPHNPGVYNEGISFEGKNLYVTSELYLYPDSMVLIDETIIDGGGIGSVVTFENGESDLAVISGFTITNGGGNRSWNPDEFGWVGGGIFCENSSPTLRNLIVEDNVAGNNGWGGGLFISRSNSLLDNVSIIGNTANQVGGIFIEYSTINLSQVIISNNSASDAAGGLRVESLSIVSLDNSLITGNSAGQLVGGILASSGSLSISNSMITGNTSPDYGAGLTIWGSTDVDIRNSVIAENISGSGRVIEMDATEMDSLHILNTIIYNNSGPDIYTTQGVINISYSDIEGGWDGENNIDADPQFCDPSEGDYYLAESSPCVASGLNGANIGAYGVGCIEPLALEQIIFPTEFVLEQNFPNPFNPTTSIKYGVPEISEVSLIIYDLRGGEIIRLVNQTQEAGWYSHNWRGVDKYGHAVATGMYLARLEAGNYSQTIKMVYLK
jgi:hypothetical protein